MRPQTKLWNSPSPSRATRTCRQECGYALLVVMMMATVLLVALTAALPSVYQEGQREREEELLFRGTQYARAIALFHRQFQRYPIDVKELLETNGMRFLRQAYTDPMSRKGKWRFIHATATGVLLDSKLRTVTSNPPGGRGSSPATPSASQAFSLGQSSAMNMPPGPTQNSPEGETPGTGKQETSAFFGEGNEIKGAFIVGVASSSHKQSIRVWNKRTRYDEWEFLGIDMGALGIATGMPGLGGGPSQPGVQGPTGTGGQTPATGQPPATPPPSTPPQPSGPANPPEEQPPTSPEEPDTP